MRSDDPLHWLNAVLWPQGDGAFVRAAAAGPRPAGPSWWASPDVAHPHTLVPVAPRRAARRAARRYHDAKGWSVRAQVLAAEVDRKSVV